MGKGPLAYPTPFWILGPLALISGCAAMLHVLLQLAGFAYVHGFGVGTQTTVLGTFMAGFAIGTILVGVRSDRSQHPLRWFGLLQIGLGCFVLGAPTLGSMLGDSPSVSSHAVALLLLPGLLAGGSATVLIRASAHTTERGALALGTTVAMTAIGAALAFPLLGLGALAAVTVPVLAGVLAWVLSIPTGQRELFASDGEHIKIRWAGDAGFAVLVGLVVVGAFLPIQRFAWNRLLPYALDTADPAATGFWLHLSGLGFGALLGTMLVSGGHNARRLLARVLLASAILTGMPLFYGDRFLDGGGMLSAALLVWPGTIGAGLILPLVAHVGLSDRESVGRQSGAIFGLFALGWACSLFVLVPALLEGTNSADMIVASAVAMLIGGTIIGFGKGLREWIPAGIATLAVVLVIIGGTETDALAARMAALRSPDAARRVVDERQSATATYAAVENLHDGSRRLYRNGLTGAPAGQYEIGYRLLGHLPSLLHGQPKRVLVVRFGTGVAASALAQHESVTEIHVVAEDEAVFELAPSFARQNRNVLEDRKIRSHVAPLRPFLRGHVGGFDIITLEPAAAESLRGRLLHTREFYAATKAALRPRGMLCQRLPVESYGPDDLRRIVAAANEQFEFVTLWDFEDGLFLLGSDGAPTLDAQPFILRFSKVGPALQQARIGDATHLLASCVGTGAGFAPAASFEPLTDASKPHVRTGSRRELRRMLADSTQDDPIGWAGELYEGLAAAVKRTRQLREVLAERQADSARLFELASADRGDLRARAAAEKKLYSERLAKRDFAGAARLDFVRDRTQALRGMVEELEGDRRDYYSILLLREGVAVSAGELDRLAQTLEGPERLYVENRARMLRGESPRAGEERLPDVELRDPTPSLEAWDEEGLRKAVIDAECGKREQAFDAVVLDWISKSEDETRAILMLHRVGWRQTIRAARKLVGRGSRDDLVAVSPLFAAAYPEDRTWERLCTNSSARVREAAADAARAHGGPAHVAALIRLCDDSSQAVRTGAFHSLEGILGETVAATGYDPADPNPEALEKLRKLR
ncbi:MAG: spermine/spermidine synthase domain-containing protein [Planctomycetota bacterium]|jgi:spermidine synthase